MSDDQTQDCQMPTASPEHEMLLEAAGTWDVDCTYYMGPDPMKMSATETVEMLGPFWGVSKFEADFMGQPFVGRCTVGYDANESQWIGTWVDSMSPHMFIMKGGYDEAGKVLTMHCRGPSMATGEMTDFRTVETRVDADQRAFEMYTTMPDGSEVMMFHYDYTRAS